MELQWLRSGEEQRRLDRKEEPDVQCPTHLDWPSIDTLMPCLDESEETDDVIRTIAP
jgi:hypothetical protein